MTDEARALTKYRISTRVGEYDYYLAEEVARALAAARAEERKKVFDEVAHYLDEGDILTSPDELDPMCKCLCFGVLGRISNWCRQQGEQDGRATTAERPGHLLP